MWTPTCYSDPGKVSDAQYFCDTDDGGGVHSNSGVPNHGYALPVDGGTFNGSDRHRPRADQGGAAVYFRAMTEYQTPTTDFADHADALEASCADLVGRPINELSTRRGRLRSSRRSRSRRRGLRHGRRGRGGGRAPQGAGAVQLQADARPERTVAVRAGHPDEVVFSRTSRTDSPVGAGPARSSSRARAARRGSPTPRSRVVVRAPGPSVPARPGHACDGSPPTSRRATRSPAR